MDVLFIITGYAYQLEMSVELLSGKVVKIETTTNAAIKEIMEQVEVH